MLVRGPRMRRGPGLVGIAARTAVVAGTATAVSGGMRRRQAANAEQATAQAAAPAAATNGAVTDDTLERLERLAALHTSGVLTDGEFAEQKAKILGA